MSTFATARNLGSKVKSQHKNYSSPSEMPPTSGLRLALPVALLLAVTKSLAEYEPAGCSDEGCGIPCYMRPVEDPCHYQPHSPCEDGGPTDLEQLIYNLNSSLHRLENKLIQKGVSKRNAFICMHAILQHR